MIYQRQAAGCLLLLLLSFGAFAKDTPPLTSRQILPSTFAPPRVWENTDVIRTVNLEKEYARETINVIIKNIDKEPQSEYYLPFDATTIARVGVLEVKDKKNAEAGLFKAEIVDYDASR